MYSVNSHKTILHLVSIAVYVLYYKIILLVINLSNEPKSEKIDPLQDLTLYSG